MNETRADIPSLDPTVLALARELAHSEVRCAALVRTRRWYLVGFVLAGALGFGAGAYVATTAGAQTQASAGAALPVAPTVVGLTREQLMAMLPAEERVRLEVFEQKVAWVSQYMRSSPQFDAGAAIALFLHDMAQAMESMPKMQADMEVMNAKMNALPFMANEVAGMNARIGIVAANMDSTMGRAGRVLPWGW
jgi:hypothetical protein